MTTRYSSYAKRTKPPGVRQRSHDRTLLTPAQAAYYLRTSVEWVTVLADGGHLPGTFRIPHKRGSTSIQPGHRRIPVRTVLDYLSRRGLPLPLHLVTAVTDPVAVACGVSVPDHRLPAWSGTDRIRVAHDPATFGWFLAAERPRVVVVGPDLTSDARDACLTLARTRHHHALRMVCHPADRPVALRGDEVGYPHPAPWAAVVARVEAVLGTTPEEEPCQSPTPSTLTTPTTKTKSRST